MSELGEDWKDYKDHKKMVENSKEAIKAYNDYRKAYEKEIEELKVAGYKVEQLSEFQYRFEGKLDIYPKNKRFHHIPSKERGDYITMKEIVVKYLSQKKVIEVNDEMYNFLMELSQEMHTQDNAYTEDPIYIVYHKVETAINDDYSSSYIDDVETRYQTLPGDDSEWMTEEEAEEYLKEYNEQEDDDKDLSDLESLQVGLMEVFVQAFYTRKAAQNHIDSLGYHYNKPYIYVNT